MLKRLGLIVGGMALAAAPFLTATTAHASANNLCGGGYASAVTDDAGNGDALESAPHGNLIQVQSPTSENFCVEEVNIESSAYGELFQFKFENNGGECATYNESQSGYVYAEACAGDSVNTLWYNTGSGTTAGFNSYGAVVAGEPAGLNSNATSCTGGSSGAIVKGGGHTCYNEWMDDIFE